MMKKTTVVSVNFEGSSKNYAFLTFESDLAVGDKVVVECTTGYQVVTVSSLVGDRKAANAYIIQKVDLKSFNAHKEAAIKYASIKRRMRARREEFFEMQEYKELAGKDAKMSELLKELDSL